MADRERRLALAGFVLMGAAALGANRWLNRPPELAFEPVEGLPGFRRAEAGAISGGFDPFIGLDTREPPPPIHASRVCSVLFRETRPGTVPVASFSDYNCPHCRVVTPDLARRHRAGEITVTWHELPLLGPASEAAARAAVAADLQGAYPAFHERLMRARVVPTPEYLERLADHNGIDGSRLIRDVASDRVTRRLEETRALANWFGVFGTPALVLGRSAVIGAVDADRLSRLLSDEAARPPDCV